VRRAVGEALERQQKRAELQLSGGAQQTLRRGPFTADLDSHRVVQNGKLLDLTPQEFTLLVYMMQNAGEAISPMDLVEAVRHYKPEYLNEARQIIKWYIHRLRQKIESDPSDPRYIVNVRGVGYLFEP
jgi:DNA-binding response OmpR family regulator